MVGYFYRNEGIGQMHNSRDFHYCNVARNHRAAANKSFELVTLRKDGQPSKMHDAMQRFSTDTEALTYIARVRSLNPEKSLRWRLNGVEVYSRLSH